MNYKEYQELAFTNKKELPASYVTYLDTLIKIALAKFGSGARTLDAFAGSGNSAAYLSKADLDVVALDTSSKSLTPTETTSFERVRTNIWRYKPEELFSVLHAKDPWDQNDINSANEILRYLLKFSSLLKPGGIMMLSSSWLMPTIPTKMAVHLADFSLISKVVVWEPTADEQQNDWYQNEPTQRGVVLCRKNDPINEKSDSLLRTVFKTNGF
jgi:2-polyprenyl-3-methyl-5-hydroxy-6-metoxy-1,4-benzoquinol methylase